MRDPCPFAKPNLHANIDVMQAMPVVLNSGLSVKATAQNMCHHSTTKKTSFKKFQKLKKSLAYIGGG